MSVYCPPQLVIVEPVGGSEKRKIKIIAWRDLDDPEAGGSERHAHEIAKRWVAAGYEVTMRTSAVPVTSLAKNRDGVILDRRGGRYQLFLQVILEGWRRDRTKFDAVVEVWNGMPFWTPLWFARKRRLIILHHVHEEMWAQTLPRFLARFGWFVEHRLAPLVYRRSRICTLSPSSAEEIRYRLHLKNVEVVPVGLSADFEPGKHKATVPTVINVGRLVPVKRTNDLIRAFVEVHRRVPEAVLDIVGDGYLGGDLRDLVTQLGATDYIQFRGHLERNNLISAYQSAWLLASFSEREGWGMTISEAAACGTPSVVSDVMGHRDAVGHHGVLCKTPENLSNELIRLLTDDPARSELETACRVAASQLSWDATATKLLGLLFPEG